MTGCFVLAYPSPIVPLVVGPASQFDLSLQKRKSASISVHDANKRAHLHKSFFLFKTMPAKKIYSCF